MPAALVPRVNPFDWTSEFAADMRKGGFDIVVGNPPFIRIQNMATYSPEEVNYYQNEVSPYATAHQDNFDKYGLFIERSLALLGPCGRLGMITPHKFMVTHAGRTLRHVIATPHLLEQVVHFGAKQVFGRRASNYTCILIMDRRGPIDVQVEQVGQLEAWRYGTPGEIANISSSSLTEEPWQFADAETTALFDRLCTHHPARLNRLAEIFVGAQTSADKIYVFRSVADDHDTVTLHWDGRDWPIERGIVRPCLLDIPLEAYARPRANSWMIFPYKIVSTPRGNKVTLIQPDEMARSFPACLAYLSARREMLEERNIVGGAASARQFYQFGRSQSLTKFNTPKIILPVLSVEPRYAYDDTNIVVTGGGNGPYYMIRARSDSNVSELYLLAVLNHAVCEAMVRKNTSVFRGGYYSHGKQFIENLPIPLPTEEQQVRVENLVTELLETSQARDDARTPHERTLFERRAQVLRGQVDAQISELFGLSAADMDIVLAVPVPG